MPARKSPPSLRRHKPSKQGVVTLNGHDHYLGHWPDGLEDAARRRPGRVRRPDRRVAGQRPPPDRATRPPPLSVAELDPPVLGAARHRSTTATRTAPRPASWATTSCPSARSASCSADTPAAEFSPLKLKAVRQHMIDAGLSRGVDQPAGRADQAGVQVGGRRGAGARAGLPGPARGRGAQGRAGRRPARRDRVEPVPDEHVEAVLPFLSGPAAGDGPGPAADRDAARGGRPDAGPRPRHGRRGVGVPPGPAQDGLAGQGAGGARSARGAQEVLRPFLEPDPDAYLFSPRAGREEWFAAKRAARKTKVQPSQACRRKAEPASGSRASSTPATRTRRPSPGRARRPACPHWHPNQLRHARATEVRGGVRAGGRPGGPRARPGERHRGVRRAGPGPGRPGRGRDGVS